MQNPDKASNLILCLQMEENAKELRIIKQFYIKIECVVYNIYVTLNVRQHNKQKLNNP